MKLIKMAEFVLQEDEKWQQETNVMTHFNNIVAYAKFLSQPITLSMFVTVDENGKVLRGKPLSPAPDSEWIRWENEEFDFYKAKDKVLFEGFQLEHFNIGGGKVDKESSFQILSTDRKIQICIYKAQPNYFIWNNSGTGDHPTIEFYVNKEIELTETAKKQIFG